MQRKAILSLLASLVCGCAADGAGTPDLAAGMDLAAPDLAYTPVLPTVTNHGGPVLAQMELWTVVWAGDELLGGELNAFHHDMFATPYYWTTILAQYGVGAGAAKGVLVIQQPKPATLAHDAIPALMATAAQQISQNANTALALLVPASTTITGVPAQEIAYHSVNVLTGLPFIVLTQQDAGFGTPFQNLTIFASHEAAEAAVNPKLGLSSAWYDDALGEQFGEIADLCNPLDALIVAIADGGAPTNGDYLLARLYNQQAAAGGKVDPCWPYVRNLPYFNVAVEPRVIVAHAGQTVSATLHVFAYGGDPGPIDWTIAGAPPGVVVSPLSGTHSAGDAIAISLTLPAGASDFPLAVTSVSQNSPRSSVYWALVQVH